MILLVGFVARFVVLLLVGTAETSVRAGYALCLGLVIACGGYWVTFRAPAWHRRRSRHTAKV